MVDVVAIEDYLLEGVVEGVSVASDGGGATEEEEPPGEEEEVGEVHQPEEQHCPEQEHSELQQAVDRHSLETVVTHYVATHHRLRRHHVATECTHLGLQTLLGVDLLLDLLDHSVGRKVEQRQRGQSHLPRVHYQQRHQQTHAYRHLTHFPTQNISYYIMAYTQRSDLLMELLLNCCLFLQIESSLIFELFKVGIDFLEYIVLLL